MAERIDALTPLHTRRQIYPWDAWMDGSMWRIRRGVDFTVTAETMAQLIRTRARADGKTATARLTSDGEGVDFEVKEATA